jgi:putative superfamily III holin-X
MSLIRTLLLTAAVRQGADGAKRRVQRGLARAAVLAFGGFLILCGLGFFAIAAHDALADWLDPMSAKLICGGVLLVIGIILFAVARYKGRSRTAHVPATAAAVGDAAAAITDDIEAALSRHAGVLTIGALVLGLLLSSRRR